MMKNKRQKKEKKPLELPSDLLGLITKKLDIDDLFSFGLVCKSWRMIYSEHWSNFLASDAPLIIQKTPHSKKACFFYSIPESRTHKIQLPNFAGFKFSGYSSGCMIMIGDRSDLLVDPFARKRTEIPKPANLFHVKPYVMSATLAFEAANSQEFIITVLTTLNEFNVLVYQSRNSNWAIYSSSDKFVIDVVVFHEAIYLLTEKGSEIGVAMLKAQRLKFLNLRSKPFTYHRGWNLRLVSSNDQLLLIYDGRTCFKIYMVDFCTMTWIELKTLGDCTLFLLARSKCYSLSNPSRWGFRSNCVYYMKRFYFSKCKVLSMDKQVIENIAIPKNPPAPASKARTSKAILDNVGWCFRPRRDVVDYSNLVE